MAARLHGQCLYKHLLIVSWL